MARIDIADHQLTITLGRAGKVWAMRRGLSVPLAHVRGATVDPGAAREPKGRRSPGLHIPGVAAVGTFHREGEKTLWEVYRGTRAIVIQLADESYDRVVVEVDDPRAAVEHINQALSGSTT